jgi:hypothetical protein
VRKAKETRGLRYDGFLYLDGRWKTVNQLGKFMDVDSPAAPTTTPAPPTAPASPTSK